MKERHCECSVEQCRAKATIHKRPSCPYRQACFWAFFCSCCQAAHIKNILFPLRGQLCSHCKKTKTPQDSNGIAARPPLLLGELGLVVLFHIRGRMLRLRMSKRTEPRWKRPLVLENIISGSESSLKCDRLLYTNHVRALAVLLEVI